MKKRLFICLSLLLIAALTACSPRGSTASTTAAATTVTATSGTTEKMTTEAKDMKRIMITVGDASFTATLQDNETARAFYERLPLTLTMQELHGNEKYYYFDSVLPSDATVPEGIHSGDIKLFGSDCLVLFYDSFDTAYSYTDIGSVDNPQGLKAALGGGNAAVTFSVEE